MIYKLLFILIITLTFTSNILAQEEWDIPENKKAKLSPYEFTKDIELLGSEIYSTNCASCHGDPGKNNFVALVPEPGDPASDKFQANSDGALYYKISNGRGTMPSFKNSLSPDDVWNVISYIRSYNSSYVQEVAKEIQRGAYDGEVSVQLTYLDDKKILEAKVIGEKHNITEAIEGAAVKLIAKRYFGNLNVGEEVVTNKDGIALFELPTDLPGDKEGNINLLAQLSDLEAFGVVTGEAYLPVGKPNNAPSLVEQRAMWNKMKKAPLWVLFSYSFAVIGAWGVIILIMFKLRKIYFIGKENK